jgi:hypothetical protein
MYTVAQHAGFTLRPNGVARLEDGAEGEVVPQGARADAQRARCVARLRYQLPAPGCVRGIKGQGLLLASGLLDLLDVGGDERASIEARTKPSGARSVGDHSIELIPVWGGSQGPPRRGSQAGKRDDLSFEERSPNRGTVWPLAAAGMEARDRPS